MLIQSLPEYGNGRCAVCNEETDNRNQGHYWSWCSVTKKNEAFHFCCPGKCELQSGEGRNEH